MEVFQESVFSPFPTMGLGGWGFGGLPPFLGGGGSDPLVVLNTFSVIAIIEWVTFNYNAVVLFSWHLHD